MSIGKPLGQLDPAPTLISDASQLTFYVEQRIAGVTTPYRISLDALSALLRASAPEVITSDSTLVSADTTLVTADNSTRTT